MGMSIVEIGKEELGECVRVIRAGFSTVAEDFGFTEQNNPSNGAFIKEEALALEHEQGATMFALKERNLTVGFMALKQRDRDTFYLEKLAVVPEFRHKGYGEAMVKHAAGYVKKAGGKRISIGIINENSQLKAWYGRLGFSEVMKKRFDHHSFTVCFMELAEPAEG